MIPPNWFQTSNPFQLPRPPVSFLWDLYRFDPALIIYQALMHAGYRVVRKHHGSPGLRRVVKDGRTGLPLSGDTLLCAQKGWMPVGTLYPKPHWGPAILADLAARDISGTYGGHQKFSDHQEQLEADAAAKQERDQASDCDDISGFAWKALKWSNGETIDVGARNRRPFHQSGMQRVAQATGPTGTRFVKLTPAEEALVLNVPRTTEDSGLILQP